ncbi:FixJ family two-component response regulator [Mucilaginibacter sp. UYNi724]
MNTETEQKQTIKDLVNQLRFTLKDVKLPYQTTLNVEKYLKDLLTKEEDYLNDIKEGKQNLQDFKNLNLSFKNAESVRAYIVEKDLNKSIYCNTAKAI